MNRFNYIETANTDPVVIAKQKAAKKNLILRSSKPHKPHPIYKSLNAPAVVAFDIGYTEEMTRAEIQNMVERVLSFGYDFTENLRQADILILDNGSRGSSQKIKNAKPTLQFIPEEMFFYGLT